MTDTMQAYCVKCKATRDMVDPSPVYTKTGSPGTRGQCAVCGTNLFKMGTTAAHAGIEKPTPQAPERKEKKSAAKAKSGKKSTKSGTKSSSKRAASSKRKSGGKSQSAAAKSGKRGAKKLVIVESPAKARSVGSFLGKDYNVMASKGHIRDLLVTQLSVDVENDFEPKYRVPNNKRDTVNELKAAVDQAEEIFLATDPDREGEAIAWHLLAATDMNPDNIKRVVFHEITDKAVEEAFSHPRDINMSLVNAQQARRILDRLVGYNITELLWDKVRNRLSAGRVQSIALRIVVEREKEIEAFQTVEYWSIEAELNKSRKANGTRDSFVAKLVKINNEDFVLNSEAEVQPHLEALEKSQYFVSDVKIGQRKRKPSAPFTTSTLQQEASRRLGFTAKRTMAAAQQLYEGIELENGKIVGLITYMRTDSLSISEQAQHEARDYVRVQFGADYLPPRPPIYKTKTRGAQEAHEAIRPTSVVREPAKLKGLLSGDQFKLYKLIWERFLASQMENAVYDTIRVEINAGKDRENTPYLLRSSGSRLKFSGFLVLYEDARDEDQPEDQDEGRILPEMSVDDLLALVQLLPEQHFTQPPPRYTEASLVRTLEEYGIGRPSTYAPTVAVIQDRDYVTKQDKRMVPTETGRAVSDLLVQYFPDEMDYQFTAHMEDKLDAIADGDGVWRPTLHEFYSPFEHRLKNARENMPQMKQEEEVGRDCPESGHPLVIKYGRFGKFIGCSNYPDCNYTEPYLEYVGLTCPVCGEAEHGQIVERKTRRGRTFYGCSRYPQCDYSAWKLPARPGANPDDADARDAEEVSVRDATG